MARSGKTAAKMTPLMQQYWEIKSAHEDKILMFRMGDFFEMFYDDAVTAAPILNIALTSRNKKSGDDTPMCGMPHHSIATPIAKLLAAGHRVALCDQIEDPKEAKGIVKRAVTRILSPGMVFDPETLDQYANNYICSFDENTLAYFETTTGEAFYFDFNSSFNAERLLQILRPVELVLTDEQLQLLDKNKFSGVCLTPAKESQSWQCPPSVQSDFDLLPSAAQTLVRYQMFMQGSQTHLTAIPQFEKRQLSGSMPLTATVLRHLEIFETYRGEADGSLFQAINRSKTSAGARLLKQWLCFPLTNLAAIEARQQKVADWMESPAVTQDIRKVIAPMGDVERRLGKVSNPSCNARDLRSLLNSLYCGLQVSRIAKIDADPSAYADLEATIEAIESTIVEEPPHSLKEGGLIHRGVSQELDELIRLSDESHQLLVELEAREKQATGIPTLKVRYNNVFGYYIEVTMANTGKVPDHYKRKQTLTNAERYVTQELHELEGKILAAKSKRSELEYEIFCRLQNKVLDKTTALVLWAKRWSELDVLTSLAWLAIEQNYCRPKLQENAEWATEGLRHPVVEQVLKSKFVPNDLFLARGETLLLTGPNMAGKSTLMRQVALASIMAQIGSFVAAKSAKLPLFTKIFTRIGASDFLNEGLSTFMVEMTETAEMLKAADPQTLVVLDEIGRGTSTYDGMSLAQAILEYLVQNKKAMSLFATHYHELTDLEHRIPQVKNAHMSVNEKDGEIEFLHTLRTGPANKSYGIQVAQLAGLPSTVVARAASLLEGLESFSGNDGAAPRSEGLADRQDSLLASGDAESAQLSLLSLPVEDPKLVAIKEQLMQATIGEMTPLQALNQIASWQSELNS